MMWMDIWSVIELWIIWLLKKVTWESLFILRDPCYSRYAAEISAEMACEFLPTLNEMR